MDDPLKKPDEPGAYVGHEPERMAETIPGGVGPDDERIAAHSTRREPDDDAADDSLTSTSSRPGEQRGHAASGKS
jgi:hypothetical protein